MASPKDSLTFRTQEISLRDEDQRDELLQGPRPELLRHAESLLSNNKSVALSEREPVIVEEDRAEHIPEAKTTTAWSLLENDHPPRDAGEDGPAFTEVL